jgi:hypothetical protein
MLSQIPLLAEMAKTVSISISGNDAASSKLADRLHEAVASQFLAHTHHRLVPDPARADAILIASITNYTSRPVILDPDTPRPGTVDINITLRIIITERKTGKVLFDDPNFEVRERYQFGAGEGNDTFLLYTARYAAGVIVGEILEDSRWMRD